MKALKYAQSLISYDSTSNLSNKVVSQYVEQKLKKHGFVTERVSYKDKNGVHKVNVIGKKGKGYGGLAYFWSH